MGDGAGLRRACGPHDAGQVRPNHFLQRFYFVTISYDFFINFYLPQISVFIQSHSPGAGKSPLPSKEVEETAPTPRRRSWCATSLSRLPYLLMPSTLAKFIFFTFQCQILTNCFQGPEAAEDNKDKDNKLSQLRQLLEKQLKSPSGGPTMSVGGGAFKRTQLVKQVQLLTNWSPNLHLNFWQPATSGGGHQWLKSGAHPHQLL